MSCLQPDQPHGEPEERSAPLPALPSELSIDGRVALNVPFSFKIEVEPFRLEVLEGNKHLRIGSTQERVTLLSTTGSGKVDFENKPGLVLQGTLSAGGFFVSVSADEAGRLIVRFYAEDAALARIIISKNEQRYLQLECGPGRSWVNEGGTVKTRLQKQH